MNDKAIDKIGEKLDTSLEDIKEPIVNKLLHEIVFLLWQGVVFIVSTFYSAVLGDNKILSVSNNPNRPSYPIIQTIPFIFTLPVLTILHLGNLGISSLEWFKMNKKFKLTLVLTNYLLALVIFFELYMSVPIENWYTPVRYGVFTRKGNSIYRTKSHFSSAFNSQ